MPPELIQHGHSVVSDGGPTTRLTSENVVVLGSFCKNDYNPQK